ncbi:hypothetical protein MMJ09_04190 [Bacillus vallismortis]|nr:hypothetical protein [Bacillus vallismortis]
MNSIIEQLSNYFNEDTSTTLAVTLLLIISLWLYKELKSSQDKDITEMEQQTKDSQNACVSILKEYELLQAKKVEQTDFYANVYENLSMLDKSISKELIILLSEDSRDNKKTIKIKEIISKHLTKLKETEEDIFKDTFDQHLFSFILKIKKILTPVFLTMLTLIFFLLAIICSTNILSGIFFFCMCFIFGLLTALTSNLERKKISLKIYIINLVIILITFFAISLNINLWFTFSSFFVCVVFIIIFLKKATKA